MTAKTRTELAEHFGVPLATMYLYCREPTFPASTGFEPRGPGRPGRRAELWDFDLVAKWMEQRRARDEQAQSRLRAQAATREEARRLRAEGMAVLDIVPLVGLAVSSVRRITADVPATPTRSLRPHPWHYTDAEMFGALKESGATTAYGYSRWRDSQPDGRPSASAIIKRHGTWKAALAALEEVGRGDP